MDTLFDVMLCLLLVFEVGEAVWLMWAPRYAARIAVERASTILSEMKVHSLGVEVKSLKMKLQMEREYANAGWEQANMLLQTQVEGVVVVDEVKEQVA